MPYTSYYIFYTDGYYILQILASRVLAPLLPNSLLLIFERILVICCAPTPNKRDSSEGIKCSFTNMATRYSLSVNRKRLRVYTIVVFSFIRTFAP